MHTNIKIFRIKELLIRGTTEMRLTGRTKLSRTVRERDEVEGETPLSIGTQVLGA